MRTGFQTVKETGLNYNSVPMKLWAKAKKYGVWNPSEIDLTQDKKDWDGLNDLERLYIARIIGQFQAGEEAVTLDLLPLIMAIAKEGRLEEEIFLTSFLWEEAKHVDGFNRYTNEIIGREYFASTYVDLPSYNKIFLDILPNSLDQLTKDPSPVNMAKASVTYNMIVEGVMAETGYFVFHEILKGIDKFPGLTEFVAKLKQDESRHVAYGIFLLSRLIAEHGDEVWKAVEDQMQLLLPLAIGNTQEGQALYEEIPFGLDPTAFDAYGIDQFQKRFARLERARHQTLEEVLNQGELVTG